MGGVGLSEFNNFVKHATPQGFVRMVVEKIWSGGKKVKLGPPEDDRQLIIGGKLKSPGQNEINLPGAAKSLTFILSISSAVPTMSSLLYPKL